MIPCRKGNKYVKQLGKLSPLIALILLIGLVATLVFHGTKVSRLGRELVAAQANVQTTRGELLQSQVCIMMHFSLGLHGAQKYAGHEDSSTFPMTRISSSAWHAEQAATCSLQGELALLKQTASIGGCASQLSLELAASAALKHRGLGCASKLSCGSSCFCCVDGRGLGCASKVSYGLNSCVGSLQRASESHRELAQQRLRHSDAVRVEMESVRARLRTAEEDNAHKQALISHNNHQVRPLLDFTTLQLCQ